MYVDVIPKKDPKLLEKIKELGFDAVFTAEDSKLIDPDDELPFDLKLYSGKDINFVITKGRADVVTDLDKYSVILNKGLCSKLKDNGMFVMFKFDSLIKTDNFYKVYKNFLINSRFCADYGVPSLYVSFASSEEEIKSPIQMIAFAEHFGYGYKAYKKSVDMLLKKK